jgi:heavy metal sensor kinase
MKIRTRLTLWYTAVLFAILVVISALSYSLLSWSLTKDIDASLLTVGQIVRDVGWEPADASLGSAEAMVREILGPEFYDKFFRLIDPDGQPRERSTFFSGQAAPLSTSARSNAMQGQATFETVRLAGGAPARLLTMPVVRGGQLVQIVQVGIPLQRARQTLTHYLQTLLVLVPVGLVLAATGGALTARTALARLDTISRTARRLSAEDLGERLPRDGTGDELDHLAETLNEMLARLEAAFAEIRRFSADAAHELRTPLTALRGGLEVALRSERTAPQYREVLASSLEDVQRLIRLAEDLLLLTRSSAVTSTKAAAVDLEPLVLDVLDTALRLAGQRGVTVRLAETFPRAGESQMTVSGDGMALRRAVLNLVENALKYTPPGGAVEISLARERPEGAGGFVGVIGVHDTGVGIAPGDLERIFDPFVRVDAARTRETGGAGLGLAIARSVVTAHGGRVEVQSTPGRGSVFTLRLPLG